MKSFIIAIGCFFLFEAAAAQTKAPHIAVAYSSQTMNVYPMPVSADAKEMPFIVSKTKSGEQFGFSFSGFPTSSPFLELLDAAGKVTKTLTVGDLFGGKSTSNVALVSSKISGSMNRVENIYQVQLPQGKATMTFMATATSLESGTVPARIVIRVSMTNYPSSIATARFLMPVTGSADIKENGIVITAAKSTQSFSVLVNSTIDKVSMANKKLSIATKPGTIGSEKLLLQMVIDAANIKSDADGFLKNAAASSTNDIVIVSTSDKETAQPTDTVTYRILCINIGKGPVSDVVITNPVSTGTQYLDGSATGDETQIAFDRAPAQAPQIGRIESITWKFSKSINPGVEKSVQFKVIVQ